MIDDQAPTDKETSTKDVHVHISQVEEDSDIRASLMHFGSKIIRHECNVLTISPFQNQCLL